MENSSLDEGYLRCLEKCPKWQEALLLSLIDFEQILHQRLEGVRRSSLSDSEVLGILEDCGIIPRNCSIWKDYGSDEYVDHFAIINDAGEKILAGDLTLRPNKLQYRVPVGDNGYRLVQEWAGGWLVGFTEFWKPPY